MLEQSLPAFLAKDHATMREIAKMDDEVDALHGHVITYLGSLSEQKLTHHETQELTDSMSAANDMESIADLVETDIVRLTEQCIQDEITISDGTRDLLKDFHGTVLAAVRGAVEALAQEDQAKAREVMAMKAEVQTLLEVAASHQAERLTADEPKRLETYTIEVELVEKLKRIYYFAKRIAKAVVPGELRRKPG